jgi:general stress protein 26
MRLRKLDRKESEENPKTFFFFTKRLTMANDEVKKNKKVKKIMLTFQITDVELSLRLLI